MEVWLVCYTSPMSLELCSCRTIGWANKQRWQKKNVSLFHSNVELWIHVEKRLRETAARGFLFKNCYNYLIIDCEDRDFAAKEQIINKDQPYLEVGSKLHK